MPLDKSGSRASIGRNIATEEAAGKPRKQSIAIALDVARRAGGNVAAKKQTTTVSGPRTQLESGYTAADSAGVGITPGGKNAHYGTDVTPAERVGEYINRARKFVNGVLHSGGSSTVHRK